MRFGRRDRRSSARTFCSGIASDAAVSPGPTHDRVVERRVPPVARSSARGAAVEAATPRLHRHAVRTGADVAAGASRSVPRRARAPPSDSRRGTDDRNCWVGRFNTTVACRYAPCCRPSRSRSSVRISPSPSTPAKPPAAVPLTLDPSTRYQPFEAEPGYVRINRGERQWVERCGGVWAADSPPALCDVIDLFHQLDVPEVVGGYLGEPPALSVNKCTLRRVGPEAYPSWHQDGAFLGKGVRSVDVWIALTACGEGTDAPGLGIAPRRIDHLLPTGTAGAMVEHSIGEPEVDPGARRARTGVPAFRTRRRAALRRAVRALHRDAARTDRTTRSTGNLALHAIYLPARLRAAHGLRSRRNNAPG